MLYIVAGTIHQDKITYSTWHVGEKLNFPKPCEVISFQADGDELLIILDALKAHSKKA